MEFDVTKAVNRRLDDQYSIDGTSSISSQQSRRAAVELRYFDGMGAQQIANDLGVSLKAVQGDLDYIERALRHRPEREELRQAFTRKMLDLAHVAHERYLTESSTVEGRLVIDAVARASKLQGLDETETERDVGGAWADVLKGIRDGSP